MTDLLKKPEQDQPGEGIPQYVPPAIITYDGDDILEELGPAQTCVSPFDCPVNLP